MNGNAKTNAKACKHIGVIVNANSNANANANVANELIPDTGSRIPCVWNLRFRETFLKKLVIG